MKHPAALLCLLASSIFGEPLAYSLLPAAGGSAAPSARVDGTIAYDPVGKQIFLFGGQDDRGVQNDLWSYGLGEMAWRKLSPSGASPAARLGHTLVFDSLRRRLILFGGQAGGFFSDVWAFDIAAGAWRQLSADNAGPTRRYGHSGIYEMTRDRLVISHGFTSAGRFDDTWAFDLASNSWRDLSPRGGRPLRRCLHHAVYDQANGEMLLYGGCSSGSGPCPQADLWSFDLAANEWAERTPRPSPAGREHYGAAFDAPRAKLVLFGGSGGALLADTWEYDPKARAWQQAAIAGGSPGARHRQQGAAAADAGAVFFFGGSTDRGYSNELWMLAAAKARAIPMVTSIVNAFSGEGGGVAPGEVVAIAGVNLGPAEAVAGEFSEGEGALPVGLADVAVMVNGVAAPLYLVSATEIRMQIPYEVSGEVSLVVAAGGEFSAAVKIPVVATHPGVMAEVAQEGETLALLVTGQGATAPASPSGARPQDDLYPEPEAAVVVMIGDRELEVIAKGQAANLAGVMRLVVRIPEDVPDGDAEVVVKVGEARSLARMVTIRR